MLENLNEPVIEVAHGALAPLYEGRPTYKRTCPRCGGALLVGRDNRTFELMEHDRCMLCAQRYRYTDIDKLREEEGPPYDPEEAQLSERFENIREE